MSWGIKGDRELFTWEHPEAWPIQTFNEAVFCYVPTSMRKPNEALQIADQVLCMYGITHLKKISQQIQQDKVAGWMLLLDFNLYRPHFRNRDQIINRLIFEPFRPFPLFSCLCFLRKACQSGGRLLLYLGSTVMKVCWEGSLFASVV